MLSCKRSPPRLQPSGHARREIGEHAIGAGTLEGERPLLVAYSESFEGSSVSKAVTRSMKRAAASIASFASSSVTTAPRPTP